MWTPVACLWAPVGTACPAGQWLGFCTVPVAQENPRAVPSAQLSPGLVPTPPSSGGRVDKYVEPFPFLSPSSLPPVLITQEVGGCSSYLTLRGTRPWFGEGGRRPLGAVNSSRWGSNSFQLVAVEARTFQATCRLQSAKQAPGMVRHGGCSDCSILSPPVAQAPYLREWGSLLSCLAGSQGVSTALLLGIYPPTCTECVPFCPRRGHRCKQDKKGPFLSLNRC